MIYVMIAVIAIVMLATTMGLIVFKKPRSKVFFVLCIALFLRIVHIAAFRFFGTLLFRIGEAHTLGPIIDACSISLYVIIIAMSVFLLVMGKDKASTR